MRDKNEMYHFLPLGASFFLSPFSFSALSFVTALFYYSLWLAFLSDLLFSSLLSLGTDLLPFPFSTADSLVFSLLMALKSYTSRPYFFFHFSRASLYYSSSSLYTLSILSFSFCSSWFQAFLHFAVLSSSSLNYINFSCLNLK